MSIQKEDEVAKWQVIKCQTLSKRVNERNEVRQVYGKSILIKLSNRAVKVAMLKALHRRFTASHTPYITSTALVSLRILPESGF